LAIAGTLPASGRHVWLREPAGDDELLVLESTGSPLETAAALAARLVTNADGSPLDWLALPAVDLAAAALLLRRAWLGTTIRTEARCPSPGCGEQIDIAFRIDAYLEHQRPRPFRGVSEPEPGWFELAGTATRFRIPTVADVLAVTGEPDPAAAMLARCVHPAPPTAALARRIERALSALAPTLDSELAGVCPLCGESVVLLFEPIGYLLEELRDVSAGLFVHVHELALAYHWSEPDILALDRRRRQGYVDLVRGELAPA
jgi:hypothetical protein